VAWNCRTSASGSRGSGMAGWLPSGPVQGVAGVRGSVASSEPTQRSREGACGSASSGRAARRVPSRRKPCRQTALHAGQLPTSADQRTRVSPRVSKAKSRASPSDSWRMPRPRNGAASQKPTPRLVNDRPMSVSTPARAPSTRIVQAAPLSAHRRGACSLTHQWALSSVYGTGTDVQRAISGSWHAATRAGMSSAPGADRVTRGPRNSTGCMSGSLTWCVTGAARRGFRLWPGARARV